MTQIAAHNDPDMKKYNAIRNRLALTEPFIMLALLAVIQISGLSYLIKETAYRLPLPWQGSVAVYALIFGTLYYAMTFYIHFYRSYVVEHRFNLSNQPLAGWIKDELKRVALSLALFLVLIEFFYGILRNYPDQWWILAALGWISLSIILTGIMPVLIIPLFFKFEPIGDPGLKESILRLAGKCGIKILDVFKLRLSAKTKKANAALVGMGKTRRVLLADTLLENYTKDEIEAVLAHELAHHKLLHIWKLLASGAAGTLAIAYMIKISSQASSGIFKIESINDPVSLPVIMFFGLLFSVALSPAQNAFSRKLERDADSLALKITGLKAPFISCMRKLAKQNLGEPSPNKFIEIMLYDHPPISKRIRMAERFNHAEGGDRDGRKD